MLGRIKVNITVVSSVGLENIHFRIQSNITTCVDCHNHVQLLQVTVE